MVTTDAAYRTFSTLHKLDDILAKLDEVAAELEKDMQEDGWVGRTITLKYKLDTYRGMHSSAARFQH